MYRVYLIASSLGIIMSTLQAAHVPQKPSTSALFDELNVTLYPILQAKSKEWADSGLVIALRHGNDTLELAAGFNDMVAAPPQPPQSSPVPLWSSLLVCWCSLPLELRRRKYKKPGVTIGDALSQ